MTRWQSFLAILAIFLVAGALWPWLGFYRLVCAALAFALVLVVLVSRLQQHAAELTGSRASIKDLESRIERIRTQREARFRRR